MIPLSILDLATVATGSTPAQALAQTTAMAVAAERLGYHRLWVAEHHAMPAVASSAPAVLLAHLADMTTTLRVGSGGVMLPNHSPLVVAEQFATLVALHPGRIDMGLGRAPGTDHRTARALRRSPDLRAESSLTTSSSSSVTCCRERDPHPTPSRIPGSGYLPEVWLLGSSTFSAHLAGQLGLPFSFAYHFAPKLWTRRSDLPDHFRPSILLERPRVMVAAASCARRPPRRRHGFRARPHSASCSVVGPNGPVAVPRGGGDARLHGEEPSSSARRSPRTSSATP